MSKIAFFVSCSPPKTGKKNSKRAFVAGGRAIVVKSKKAVEVERTWHELLKDYQPREVMTGPLRLAVKFYYPPIGSDTSNKAKREYIEQGGEIWHESRPDLSNVVQALEDVMTTLRFFGDDAQIVQLDIQKKRRKDCGVLIELEGIS